MSEQKISNKKSRLLSWIIFLPTLIIVLFTLILGMFPALLITFSDKVRFPIGINVFEPGIWMFPILISSTIIFATIILYRKNKLPQKLTSLFKFILNFEISPRTALVFMGILIASYAILNVEELYDPEPWGDYPGVEQALKKIELDDLKLSVKIIPNLLALFSMEVFGTYRIPSFFASILCLFLTYLITVQISKKRFAGIVAVCIVLQSDNFLIYNTLITYPIMWITFYLLSIYFIFKSFALSTISFVAAALSHPLAVGLFPLTIAMIVLSDLPKRKKILVLSSYAALAVVALVAISAEIVPNPVPSFDGESSIDVSRIISAFASI